MAGWLKKSRRTSAEVEKAVHEGRTLDAASAPTRECRACGGTGNGPDWHRPIVNPAGSYQHPPCPVCAGSGRVDAKASRADAVADAETLRRELYTSAWEFGFDWGGKVPYLVADPASIVRMAARAAFRAVPGLRGALVSAPTRECRACGGSGFVSDDLPACGTFCHHVGQPHESPCPVCLGSGRVDAKASRADAVADAETLRNALGVEWTRAERALLLRSGAYATKAASDARAAFRAVPGLRGAR